MNGAGRERAQEAGGGRGIPAVLVVLLLAGLLPACSARPVELVAAEHVRATARQDVLHRWPAGTELVVDVTTLSDRDARSVFRAFDAWLAGASVPLRVRRSEPGEAANVVFRSVAEVREGYEGLGLTRLEWEGSRLVAAEVELAGTTRCGGFLSSTERRRTVLHEVGHVLGLGHSPRLSSIMHRSTPGSAVDARDRAALDLLYSLAAVRVAATAPEPD